MNNDLISRSALCEKLQAHKDFFVNAWGGFGNLPPKDKARVDEITHCIAETMNAPAVDDETVFEAVGLVKEAFDMAKSSLAPVRHGRWGRHRDYDHQVCSECKRSYETNWFYTLAGYRPFNYCPNCGAKMDKEG